jgi:alkaline phosphatase
MRRLFYILFLIFIQVLSSQENPPNIILMIGDGMGLTQITTGMYANGNKTSLEEFDYIGLSKTHSLDALVTDSAASATAMASGIKTLNRTVGIDKNNNIQKSILEICKEKNYNVGLVVTSEIVHATPACFYANVPSRYDYEDIALQLSEHNVDLFVGGGKKFFNKRKDKRNLLDEMTSYTFVDDFVEFKDSSSKKIGFLTYPGEPPPKNLGREPSLDMLTEVSLRKLSKDKSFFIMIEGSQIDWGGHDNSLNYILSEFKEFDLAIGKALEFAKADGNTLVIVTADHETGGMALSGGNVKRSSVRADFTSGEHSGSMVPVFSYGPYSELFKGIYENTAIFDKMLSAVMSKD